MCVKAQAIPGRSEIEKALAKKSPTFQEFHETKDMRKEWKSFLAEADKICLEDPDDPERCVVICSVRHRDSLLITVYPSGSY